MGHGWQKSGRAFQTHEVFDIWARKRLACHSRRPTTARIIHARIEALEMTGWSTAPPRRGAISIVLRNWSKGTLGDLASSASTGIERNTITLKNQSERMSSPPLYRRSDNGKLKHNVDV
jgi:hypothetical protein